MNKQKTVNRRRLRRRNHVRNKVRGNSGRPRLCVFRSHKNIACQIIDDLAGKTLVSAGTADKDLRGDVKNGGNREAAVAVGKAIAAKAKAAGIEAVSFDRGSYRYHGRVAALADAAREAGLQF